MPEFSPGLIPSPSRLPAILIGGAVMATVAALAFHFGQHQTAELALTRTQIYAVRTEQKPMPGSMHVIGATGSVENDLYVVLSVKLTDKLHEPIYIESESAVLTAPDSSVLETDSVQKNDLPNLYTTFPAVQALSSAPLTRGTQIDPGQSAEGMVILHFPGTTEDNWKARQSAVLTIGLLHQPAQTIKIP